MVMAVVTIALGSCREEKSKGIDVRCRCFNVCSRVSSSREGCRLQCVCGQSGAGEEGVVVQSLLTAIEASVLVDALSGGLKEGSSTRGCEGGQEQPGDPAAVCVQPSPAVAGVGCTRPRWVKPRDGSVDVNCYWRFWRGVVEGLRKCCCIPGKCCSMWFSARLLSM